MKRTVKMAKAGIPSAKLGAPPAPLSGRPGLIRVATADFLLHGAQAAAERLGGSLRARILLPRVLARAQFLERQAKRLSAFELIRATASEAT